MEEFRNNFITWLLCLYEKPPQNASQSFGRTPQAQPQPTSNWNETLNSNKAGSATNAEDFTKQFMADMFGGGRNRVLCLKILDFILEIHNIF